MRWAIVIAGAVALTGCGRASSHYEATEAGVQRSVGAHDSEVYSPTEIAAFRTLLAECGDKAGGDKAEKMRCYEEARLNYLDHEHGDGDPSPGSNTAP